MYVKCSRVLSAMLVHNIYHLFCRIISLAVTSDCRATKLIGFKVELEVIFSKPQLIWPTYSNHEYICIQIRLKNIKNNLTAWWEWFPADKLYILECHKAAEGAIWMLEV